MSGAVLVKDALGSAGLYGIGGGVGGWWWPWAGGVGVSEFFGDLCNSMVEFTS